MNLRTKLISAFSIILVLMIVMGVVNLQTHQQLVNNFDDVIDETTPTLITLGQIKETGVRMLVDALSVTLFYNAFETLDMAEEIEIAREIEELEITFVQLAGLLNQYEQGETDPEQIASIDQLREASFAINAAALQLIDMTQLDRDIHIVFDARGNLEDAEEAFLLIVEAAMQAELEELATNRESVEASVSLVRTVNPITVAITVFLSAMLGFSISRYLIRAINQLKESAQAIGEGQLDTQVDIQSSDELGVLGAAFNRMAVQLKTSQEALSHANASLEQRVERRTLELQKTQAELQKSNTVLEQKVQERTEELHQQNRKLSRTHEFMRATLDQMVDSVGRGALADELSTYIAQAQSEFDRLE
jgi:nitrogen fixation/metabolism regulation signal transduction histidine kinase